MARYIDPIIVRLFFSYNKDTGVLVSKRDRGIGGRHKAGKAQGSLHKCGPKKEKEYLRLELLGYHLYVHRIIWVLMTGEQPKEIDHIDGNGLNNKWSNLRSVNHKTNGRNQKKHITNTSGASGVTFRKDSGRWRARIMVDDVMISLGTFKNKDDAIKARKEAEKKYSFTVVH